MVLPVGPSPSFHKAGRPTEAVGLLLCAAFVVISLSLRPRADDTRVLVKADRLMRTASDEHRSQ